MTKEYNCRFCFESEKGSEGRKKMIVPCDCDGSSKYVHIECLNSWFKANLNTDKYDICNSCNGKYIRRGENNQ